MKKLTGQRSLGMKAGALFLYGLSISVAKADSITHGTNTVDMEFVRIAFRGNAKHTTGKGRIGYHYRIGKFEVTKAQWDAVQAADSHVGTDSPEAPGRGRYANHPAGRMRWIDAARFANWLTSGNAHDGAYRFSSEGVYEGVNRLAALAAYETVYVLPTEDEWHKAAYFKADGSGYSRYSTGESVPDPGGEVNYDGFGTPLLDYTTLWQAGNGLEENNGTFAMAGNVWEWTETAVPGSDRHAARGGDYASAAHQIAVSAEQTSYDSRFSRNTLGFRIAVISADEYREPRRITHGATTVSMDFARIGHTDNAHDPATYVEGVNTISYGVVGYSYRISLHEVTAAQWEAVRLADGRVGDISVWSGEQPVGGVSWLEAARFANWLTSGDVHKGAYRFSSTNVPADVVFVGVDRMTALATYETVYVLPTEDEWYKAAYFKADGSGYTTYPTGNELPVVGTNANYGGATDAPWDTAIGTIENNGTYDMGGNLAEWLESPAIKQESAHLGSASSALRGGHYRSTSADLAVSTRPVLSSINAQEKEYGFRIAAIHAPPAIIRRRGSDVEISWNSLSGETYQIRRLDSLTEGDWVRFGNPVEGDGTAKSAVDSTSADSRFYRIVTE